MAVFQFLKLLEAAYLDKLITSSYSCWAFSFAMTSLAELLIHQANDSRFSFSNFSGTTWI